MKILLDLEGVMITFPAWQPAQTHSDGFLAFSELSVKNLNKIIAATGATLVLTSTHRVKYPLEEWKAIFERRGIVTVALELVNDCKSQETVKPRYIEIAEWVAKNPNTPFIILDDDPGLSRFPDAIKNKWVQTKVTTGIDDLKAEEAIAKARQ